MTVNIKEISEKFIAIFKLKDYPIAFFYTDDPPQKVFKPKPMSIENITCIIRLLRGVRQGRTLVLGKESRNLCPGGLAYLGFSKRMPGLEYYLSTGAPNEEGKIAVEGERFIKTPQMAKLFFESIPFNKSPAKYAVFMPLDQVDLEIYKPLIVIFFVNMDQLAGLIQLANYDAINNRTILGHGSGCSTIITEPLAELNKLSRPIIGMLTDVLSRRHIGPDETSFTIAYERLLQIYENIDESFLNLQSWKKNL